VPVAVVPVVVAVVPVAVVPVVVAVVPVVVELVDSVISGRDEHASKTTPPTMRACAPIQTRRPVDRRGDGGDGSVRAEAIGLVDISSGSPTTFGNL
jgi:hypothetical protein